MYSFWTFSASFFQSSTLLSFTVPNSLRRAVLRFSRAKSSLSFLLSFSNLGVMRNPVKEAVSPFLMGFISAACKLVISKSRITNSFLILNLLQFFFQFFNSFPELSTLVNQVPIFIALKFSILHPNTPQFHHQRYFQQASAVPPQSF